MTKAKIADTKPIAVQLEAEQEYYWCSCGLSQSQPFCDGSHRSTRFTPQAFTVGESQEAYLCLCKRSNSPPFCDGSHARLEEDEKINDAVATSESLVAKNTPEEPTLEAIHHLADSGLTKTGHHGEMDAMGVPRHHLPHWDDIQILTAQFANKPLLDDVSVNTELVIGRRAKRPLHLKIPIFVSDMSFGALSEEAKIALATGAERAGTGICSGEGGMLPEEQESNSKYFYELASAQFGYHDTHLNKVQAFHFKGGQAAKTGTGGHLPGNKVTEKIAKVRHIPVGISAISPATFPEFTTAEDFKKFANYVRKISDGIPVGMKLSANHIEQDIEFAIQADMDYIILDGRGGGTGAAPLLFRNHISVPTIPALARARHYLNKRGQSDMTLIITGGLRTPADFIKALCLGADGIAIANSAMQSIGCVAARMCHTNNCPAGIATQKPELRAKLDIEKSANQLARFLASSTQLIEVMARACGHNHINQFNRDDLTTWKKEIAELSGISYAGFDALR